MKRFVEDVASDFIDAPNANIQLGTTVDYRLPKLLHEPGLEKESR